MNSRTRVKVGAGLLGGLSIVDALSFGNGLRFQVLLGLLTFVLLAPVFGAALRRVDALLMVVAWIAVVVVSLAFYPGNDGLAGANGVLLRSVTLLPALMLIGYAAGRDADTAHDILIGLLAASLVVSGLFLAGAVRGAGHIEAGRIMAIGLPVLAAAPRIPRPARWLGAALLVTSSVATGARAPLVFGVLSAALSLLLARRGARHVSLRPLILGGLVLVIGSVVLLPRLSVLDGGAVTTGLARQTELLSARSLADLPSGRDRLENYYTPAIEQIRTHLLVGKGWPADVSDKPGYQYSHNLLLELGVAFGVLGLLGAFALVLLIIRFIWARGPDRVALAGVLAFVLANAMVSGDLVVNRYVMFAVGVIAGDHAWMSRRGEADPGHRVSAPRSTAKHSSLPSLRSTR